MIRPLLLTLGLSALLALGYAWATPLGAAPDEGAHLTYVRVVATEGRLPSLNMEQRRESHADPHYESHQAPLYYVLSALFYLAGRAVAGDPGAGYAVRLLSILIGLAGTALIWLLAREVAPERPALWTAAAGVAAFLPMRLSVNSSVSNDPLAEATSTLALLLMVRGIYGAWDLRRALVLGVAIAAALLSKSSAILLLPPALLAVFLASARAARPSEAEAAPQTPDSPRRGGSGKKTRTGRPKGKPEPATSDADEWAKASLFFRTGLAVLLPVLLLSGWWFVRNHLLYGDPLGQRAFNWYFEDTPRWADFRDAGRAYSWYMFQLVMPTAFATFWGAFGHLDRPELFMGATGRGYPPPSWVYPILQVAVLIALAGGVRYYLKWRGTWGEGAEGRSPAGVGVLALHGLFVVAAFFNFNATYFQAQGRYLFPAIGILSLALAGGWLEWTSKREWTVAWVVVGLMAVLAVYALFAVLVPAFPRS